jgi:hypothetical protein
LPAQFGAHWPHVPHFSDSTSLTQMSSHAVWQQYASSAQTQAWMVGSSQPGLSEGSQQCPGCAHGPQSCWHVWQDSPASHLPLPHDGPPPPHVPQLSDVTSATQMPSHSVLQQ